MGNTEQKNKFSLGSLNDPLKTPSTDYKESQGNNLQAKVNIYGPVTLCKV